MLWQWRLEDGGGKVLELQEVAPTIEMTTLPEPGVAGGTADTGFEMQGDAETWIGLCWRPLHEGGVAKVFLLHGTQEVYGPMDLAPQTMPLPRTG